MSLTRQEIASAFKVAGTDKYALHGYDQMYSKVFERYPVITKMLEIGVFKGTSLAAWRRLFPDIELVGVDRRLREDIVEAGRAATLIEADSARTSIKEKVGEGYNIIIDDGDHRPDWQWQTFLNLRHCWTDAYIIEDVLGIEHENLLRKRLASHGYYDVETFASKLSEAKIQMNGEKVVIAMFAMVIHARR